LHDAQRAKDVIEQLDPIFKTLAPGRGDIPRTQGVRKPVARLKMDTSIVVHRALDTS
jgi:hypothetical protein